MHHVCPLKSVALTGTTSCNVLLLLFLSARRLLSSQPTADGVIVHRDERSVFFV